MRELMKNIVFSEDVQELLTDIREEGLVTPEKYAEICNEIQATIISEPEIYILEPIEIAALIEEAIMIYSSKKRGTNFPISSVSKSVELAFQKQVGAIETNILI